MIEVTDFRNAMSLLTGAVNVVTTIGVSGRYGFTASSVCSISDTPATLLVCMNKAASSHAHFIENRILTVNVLGAHHQHLSKAFSSKMSPEERFGYADWTELKTGAPVLEDALVSFDCESKKSEHILFLSVVLSLFNKANRIKVWFILIVAIIMSGIMWVRWKSLKPTFYLTYNA
jgi:flavin reductase